MQFSEKVATVRLGHQAIFRRAPGQCKCTWCGRALRSDKPCFSDDEKAFLLRFAMMSGKAWKRSMCDRWLNSTDCELVYPEMIRRNLGEYSKEWLRWFSLAKAVRLQEVIDRRDRARRKLDEKIQERFG